MSGRRLSDGMRAVSPGRISELSEVTIKNICDAIRLGCFPITAALYAQVDPHTFRYWIRRGIAEPETRYGELLRAMQQSLGASEMRDVAALESFVRGRPAEYLLDKDGIVQKDDQGKPIVTREEIKPNLNAIMFKLDRRWQERWGKVVKFDDSLEALTGDIQSKTQDLSVEDAEKDKEHTTHILKQLSKAGYLDDEPG
jgi:hypothetical protein